jgi:hypothetical protein
LWRRRFGTGRLDLQELSFIRSPISDEAVASAMEISLVLILGLIITPSFSKAAEASTYKIPQPESKRRKHQY